MSGVIVSFSEYTLSFFILFSIDIESEEIIAMLAAFESVRTQPTHAYAFNFSI
jgi:hypothetical protein